MIAPEISKQQTRLGLIYGFAAYIWWGMAVVYFKLVSATSAEEILAHRIIWSLLLLCLLMTYRKRWPEVRTALKQKQILLMLSLTTFLVASNWFVFIWAVTHEQIVQASLGYYINPLVSMLLGFVFLKERLRFWQKISAALAFISVTYLTLKVGVLPWVSLYLAFSFGLYGLIRKVVRVDSMLGLTIETGILFPIALAYLIFCASLGTLDFLSISLKQDLLLMLSGVVTALPLLWFAHAARRLRLSTIGFLQFLAPSLQLLIGVLLYNEPFTLQYQITFAVIWTALLIYSMDAIKGNRAK